MAEPIPYLDLKAQIKPLRAEIDAAVARTMDNCSFTVGLQKLNGRYGYPNPDTLGSPGRVASASIVSERVVGKGLVRALEQARHSSNVVVAGQSVGGVVVENLLNGRV